MNYYDSDIEAQDLKLNAVICSQCFSTREPFLHPRFKIFTLSK